MEVGSIVFAPLNQKLWPGKIISLGMMAQVQFYKIKTVVRVPIKTLHDFSQPKLAILLKIYKDKAFVAAVKMAHKEFNETWKPYQEGKKKRDRFKGGKKTEQENLAVEKQKKPVNLEQPMKKEEEDVRQNEIVWASSVPQFILTLNQKELLSEVIENKPKQFCFMNSTTKEMEQYLREPRFVLARLTQKLMKKLWFEQDKSKSLQIEKRIKTIISSWDVDIKNIQTCDFWRIIKLTVQRRENMPWITDSYIDDIQNFMKKMQEKISNKLDDYSEIGVLMNQIAGLRLSA